MDKFNHERLPELYKNCRKGSAVFSADCVYIFSSDSCDYLELYILAEGNYHFIDDNFPAPRRFFNSNIPINNIEEFESDLKRMRIKIPERI